MSSIFDQNSEFLKYLNGKNSDNTEIKSDPAIVEMHIGEEGQLLKKTEKSNESYVLNLRTHQIREPRAAETVPVKKASTELDNRTVKKIEKLQQISVPRNPFKEKIKFLFTTALIFSVSFVFLNWSAYKTVFYGYYLDLTGQELNSPLSEFTEVTESTFTNAVYASADIPKLNLEVTPPGTRIIIPRLGSNVPVVSVSDEKLLARNWEGLEADIQDALKGGVVHYPGTPYPNQSGNVVITGHSSYYPWDPGRFKDVFAVLHQAEVGDEILIFHDQKKYKYQVVEIKKILPTEINVLGDSGDDRLTLITCTPIGTNLKRLIVIAKPVAS